MAEPCRAVGGVDPNYAKAYGNRGVSRLRKGDFERGLADLNEAVRLNPDLPVLHYNLGITWLKRGDPDKAIAHFRNAIRIQPDFTAAYNDLALAWKARGDYTKATETLADALRTDPADPGTLNKLAWLLATCPEHQHRDGARAVELATKACELTEWQVSDCVDTLAAAAAEAGDFAAAAKWQAKAIEMGLEDEETETAAEGRLASYRDRKPHREEFKK